MPSPVYNSAILNMRLASRAFSVFPRAQARLCAVVLVTFLLIGYELSFAQTSWSEPEQQLAQKIVAITGPGTAALTIASRSTLGRKETDIISDGLRATLESSGIRFTAAESAAATISITLSESQTSYVWVAEIHQGAGESAVAIVSISRPASAVAVHDSVPMTLQKTLLWTQPERILDVAVLEESNVPTQIAVLDPARVTLYHWQAAKWEPEQSLAITHAHPWPRDLRGRLVPAKDHLLDVYLPGVICHITSAVTPMVCRDSDDPWPLGSSGSQFDAFFAPTRTFFIGVISSPIGKFSSVPNFYSLAFVPRDKYVLWLFAGVDGSIHMIDGVSDLTIKAASDKAKWGSDIAGVHTSCGATWQVLAVSPGGEDDEKDSVRAYEFPERDAVAVSAPLEFPGEVTALWTEAKGDSAIAVARNTATGEYEAFRLSMACGQ